MPRILYIFPHPDDESFGPAPAIAQQQANGHEVHLLTLTKGGATKQRHKLGLSVDEMGELRFQEMKCVAQTLGLDSMEVLDLPDSGLKDLCPIEIEHAVHAHIKKLQPDIIVTYAVHGISGFFDHLVSHAAVKRVFCELRQQQASYCPRRLAFFTLGPDSYTGDYFKLKTSPASDIDCITKVTPQQALLGRKALLCYESYLEVIEKTQIAEHTSDDVHFEFFGESFDPPVSDLGAGLKEPAGF
ncbi:MAG: PIG-L deacetylase family protein [Cyclonatronaceae bacterium]